MSATRGALLRLLLAIGAMALFAAVVGVSEGALSQTAPAPERLPDLDQELPSRLQVTRDGSRFRLGFRSAVRNVGAGPLVVVGQRRGLDSPTMTADQLIQRRGAPQRVVESVGRLRYVRSPDHEHWHLLGFERYVLRQVGGRGRRVKDRKTGFCLGDRYGVGRRLPRKPAAPVYTSRCGLGATGLMRLEEGISVGYGDDYPAILEGQSLPLSGLPAGRYVLEHHVNVGRRLRESRYANNASSLLLDLRRRSGVPRLRVLRSCPRSARCERR